MCLRIMSIDKFSMLPANMSLLEIASTTGAQLRRPFRRHEHRTVGKGVGKPGERISGARSNQKRIERLLLPGRSASTIESIGSNPVKSFNLSRKAVAVVKRVSVVRTVSDMTGMTVAPSERIRAISEHFVIAAVRT